MQTGEFVHKKRKKDDDYTANETSNTTTATAAINSNLVDKHKERNMKLATDAHLVPFLKEHATVCSCTGIQNVEADEGKKVLMEKHRKSILNCVLLDLKYFKLTCW